MAGKRGAPFGNVNAVHGKNRKWRAALDRAIAQDSADRLRQAAESLLTQAAEGEQWAIKELGDRLDGKAAQAIDANVTGDLIVEIKRYCADIPAE